MKALFMLIVMLAIAAFSIPSAKILVLRLQILRCVDHQFCLEEFSNFNNCIVVLSWRFTKFSRVNGNARVNVVVQSKCVLEHKVPHQRIKIISLLCEFNIEVIRKNVGDFIKSLQATIVINNCFGTAEVGA